MITENQNMQTKVGKTMTKNKKTENTTNMKTMTHGRAMKKNTKTNTK